MEKSALLKIATQAFEAGDFLNIFINFGVFEAHFLIKIFLIKKTKSQHRSSHLKGFYQKMFKATIHLKRFWQQKDLATSKNLLKILVYGIK